MGVKTRFWVREAYPVLVGGQFGGRAEGYELLGDDPVEVPVLQFLVVLVLGQVECLVVEPAKFQRVLQSPQTVQQLSECHFTVHL